jgi:hypothetical protein
MRSELKIGLVEVFKITKDFDKERNLNFQKAKMYERRMIHFTNLNNYVRNSLDPNKITLLDFNALISFDLKTGTITASSNCDAYSAPSHL